MPNIVKSSSSTEKAKMETLYSPNKRSAKLITGNVDSGNSNNQSKSSSMNLCDDSKGLKLHYMTF
jgi:hypothetical protein